MGQLYLFRRLVGHCSEAFFCISPQISHKTSTFKPSTFYLLPSNLLPSEGRTTNIKSLIIREERGTQQTSATKQTNIGNQTYSHPQPNKHQITNEPLPFCGDNTAETPRRRLSPRKQSGGSHFRPPLVGALQ